MMGWDGQYYYLFTQLTNRISSVACARLSGFPKRKRVPRIPFASGLGRTGGTNGALFGGVHGYVCGKTAKNASASASKTSTTIAHRDKRTRALNLII